MKDKNKIVTIILAVVCVISIIGVIYLYTANSSLKSENANLQSELENTQNQINELQDKITELEATIESLKIAKANIEIAQTVENAQSATSGVDGVISEEDIAAGAYDEELNGEDTTSETTDSDYELMKEAAEWYEKETGENIDYLIDDLIDGGSSESVPDHIEGNPLPEGKYTPDNGDLGDYQFDPNADYGEEFKGAFIQ